MSDFTLPDKLDARWVQTAPWPWDSSLSTIQVIGEHRPPHHVEPIALVALSAWAAHRRRAGQRIEVDASLQSPYMWQIGLLSALSSGPGRAREVHPTESFIPLCWFSGHHDADQVLGAALSRILHGPTLRATQAIGSTVKEIAYNASEHGRNDDGDGAAWFAAGWFRNQRRVTFAIADLGPTIRGHLDRKGLLLPEDDDLVALEKALTPGVTGAGRPGEVDAPDNAGLGLFMVREYVRGCNGQLTIWSGDGVFTQLGHARTTLEAARSRWPGTIVSVTIRPDQVGAYSTNIQGPSAARFPFRVGPPAADAIQVHVPADKVGFTCGKDWAIRTRPRLAAALEEQRPIHLDFGSASYATQSGLHALLYEPLRDHGDEAATLLSFSELRGPIEQVVHHVVAYSMDAHLIAHSPSRA